MLPKVFATKHLVPKSFGTKTFGTKIIWYQTIFSTKLYMVRLFRHSVNCGQLKKQHVFIAKIIWYQDHLVPKSFGTKQYSLPKSTWSGCSDIQLTVVS